MSPGDFINRQLLAGRKNEICEMLSRYKKEMAPPTDDETFAQYACLTKLLLFVQEALQELETGKNLAASGDIWLQVWQATGYFGIDRKNIQKQLEAETKGTR